MPFPHGHSKWSSPRKYCSKVISAFPKGKLSFFPLTYAIGCGSVSPRIPIVQLDNTIVFGDYFLLLPSTDIEI